MIDPIVVLGHNINEKLMKLGEKMEKIKQIHLRKHLYLDNQKPLSAENGIKWLQGQCYIIHTVIYMYISYWSFIFLNIDKIFRNWGKMQNK